MEICVCFYRWSYAVVKSGLNLNSEQNFKMSQGHGLYAHVMIKSSGVSCLLKFCLCLIWNRKTGSIPIWKETQNPNYMSKLTSWDWNAPKCPLILLFLRMESLTVRWDWGRKMSPDGKWWKAEFGNINKADPWFNYKVIERVMANPLQSLNLCPAYLL